MVASRENAGKKPIIKVKGLSFRYKGVQSRALNNVNLDLYPGTLNLLTGPIGSGKSTLALCFNGLIPNIINGEFDGEVDIMGTNTRESATSEMATKVGIVFQDPEAQIFNIYVENELAFGCENLQFPVDLINQRIDYFASVMGLSDLMKCLCNKLSGGQKQRVALVSILAMGPRILILDEPTSNLDCKGTNEFIECLKILKNEQKITIVLIEHKIDEVIELVDQVIIMDKGNVTFSGAPKDVYSKHGQYLYANSGIWIPQIVEFAIEYRKKRKVPYSSIPVTVNEAYQEIKGESIKYEDNSNKEKKAVDRTPLFSLINVSYEYEKNAQVLYDISLDIFHNDVMAIVGANGSGKTTLSKLLLGLLKVKQGQIMFKSRNINAITKTELAQKIGYIFQNPEVQFIQNTVLEELNHRFSMLNAGSGVVPQLALDILNKYGLSDVKNQHPFELSMGQKRMLCLAMLDPLPLEALIIDEPIMGIDYFGMCKLMQRLHERKLSGTTIIIITHEMRLLTDMIDRIVVLNSGTIIADTTPHDFFSSAFLLNLLSISEPPVVRLSKKYLNNFSNTKLKLALTSHELIELFE